MTARDARGGLALALLLLLAAPVSAQVTLQHAQRVIIKPAVPDTHALTIWGGLRGGLDGTVQIVNADGTLNIPSSSIADGSITFAKWHPNGCATSDVPRWNGSAWVCASVAAAGGLTEASNAIVTGTWRFSTSTVVGDVVTPQQLVHIYKATAEAAIRLEQGDGAWWDLTANGTQLRLSTETAGLQATWTTTGLGLGTTPTTRLDVNGTTTTTGLIVNGSIGSHVTPSSSDAFNLGSSSALWGTAWISQLNALVFAEATATLFGGHSIIGHDAGSLGAVLNSVDATADFGKAMSPGDWVLIRAHDAAGTIRVEYLLVGALSSGTRYVVTRDVLGVHVTDPVWSAGTAFLVLGTVGDGRIELNAYDTPRIAIRTQGATAALATDLVRIGYLDGISGVPANRLGIYVGDVASQGFSYYDGVLTVRGAITATSGSFSGDISGASGTFTGGLNSSNVTITGGGVTLSATGLFISPIAASGGGTYANTNAVRWTTDPTYRTAIWRSDDSSGSAIKYFNIEQITGHATTIINRGLIDFTHHDTSVSPIYGTAQQRFRTESNDAAFQVFTDTNEAAGAAAVLFLTKYGSTTSEAYIGVGAEGNAFGTSIITPTLTSGLRASASSTFLVGNTTAGGTFNVDGAASFDTTVLVTGAATLSSTLNVTGIITASSSILAGGGVIIPNNTHYYARNAADSANVALLGIDTTNRRHLTLGGVALVLNDAATGGVTTGITGYIVVFINGVERRIPFYDP